MMNKTPAVLTVLLALVNSALIAAPVLHEQVISAAGNDAVIQIYGSDVCTPNDASVTRDGSDIVIDIDALSPGTPCFPTPRLWTLIVAAPDLADDAYDVDVRWGDPFGSFAFQWPLDGIVSVLDSGFTPSQGMWWSSENPGTGMAFNIDDEGRWFAALYLYDEAGAPTFLTMQGQALTYEPNALPPRPYAVGVSPLIRSDGGQCLKCPWRNPATSDTGDEAVLTFHNRNRATLSVGGGWRLDLNLLPEQHAAVSEKALPLDGRHYLMIMDGTIGQHAVIVRTTLDDTGMSNMSVARFHCLDCRTVDGDGNASGPVDEFVRDRVENHMKIQCIANACTFFMADDHAGTTYIDDTGVALTTRLVDHRTPSFETTRIELRLLPEEWR